MWVMAILALDPGLRMHACPPLVCCGLMACAAQVGIWSDRHRELGVPGLKGTMASFAGDTFLCVPSGFGVIAGGVTLKAGDIMAHLRPIALEDWGRECLSMTCG